MSIRKLGFPLNNDSASVQRLSRRMLRAVALFILFVLLILRAPTARADTATTTIGVGSTPYAVAVNSVTNKIYVANILSANVTVIDGATNATQTVSVGTIPRAVAVNPVTNKIYVANSSSANVTVIDGATNATSTVSAGASSWGVAVNPVTNKIFITNYGSANVTVIDEQRTQAIPIFVGITPLANNLVMTSTPTFTFVPKNYSSPFAPPVQIVYYQVDTWQNAWSAASSTDGTTWTGTTGALGTGVHVVYAWAGDGAEATSINAAKRAPRSSSSPIIGQIAAYVFEVVPSASVSLSPSPLNFGNQAINTTSSPQAVTLTNTGAASLTINHIATTADFSQ
ncbi:MAG: YncE family protein [Chloroflexi bacterium]|nr:YncE family protein [Chloroflexota bacterium]